MTTIGIGGFGKAKLTTYKGKQAVVKYININSDPSATLATCTINRIGAFDEGFIMVNLRNNRYIADMYGLEGHAIYMKYYPLGSLRSQIDQGNVSGDKYHIAYHIIKGVSALHSFGYIHSDLKASNILCEQVYDWGKNRNRIRAVVSDFGASKKEGTYADAFTPGFCPPEIKTKPLSPATDVYSLGKLIFRTIYGN